MDDRPGTSGLKEGSVVGERAAAIDKVGLLNLLVVYVVWGTTYLAIRVAVREGSGFPPFTMGTMRVLTAGILLLAWGALSGQRLRLSRQEFTVLAETAWWCLLSSAQTRDWLPLWWPQCRCGAL
jgi:hypothetical protein